MVESNALLEEAARLAEAARELQEAAAILISRTRNEEQSLRQSAVALESDLRRLQSSLDSTVRKKGESTTGGGVDPKIAEKVDEVLCRARCVINDGDVASLLLSMAHGRFLKMFLGPVNVRATRKEVQLKVKEEYNSYRTRLSVGQNSLLISSISVHSSSFEILGLGWVPSSIACPAISGLAVIPIHNFSFAGKHIESKWK
ncbi:TMPIT-like protein [Musa troglodytarum]|uniref:TMPIT-like protein n=1 Tax=Musa troglodytarum TaxID=320322 RepID=A0A9E7F6U1_9LILI|nr:TMPIT-like protein [Musa troglodytarum]